MNKAGVLRFIYERLLYLYYESPNIDFMRNLLFITEEEERKSRQWREVRSYPGYASNPHQLEEWFSLCQQTFPNPQVGSNIAKVGDKTLCAHYKYENGRLVWVAAEWKL
jgi:hypothetical protein